MQNIIPKKAEELRAAAEAVAGGVTQYGDSIPLEKTSSEDMTNDITSLVDALTGVRTAREELNTRRATVSTALAAARKFLTDARNSFKLEYGNEIKPVWAATGLTNSLVIPQRESAVLGLLGSFKEFLGTHPTFEIAAKNITAAHALLLFTQLSNARNAENAQATHVQGLALDRDAQAAALRKRISTVMAELKMHLAPLDARWLAFGLNQPGAPTTPVVPADVRAVLFGTNAAQVAWKKSTYAKHYRVWMKVVGVDEVFVNVGNTTNLNFLIENLPANAQVQIMVSAVNSGLESLTSQIVTVTTP